MKLTQHEEGLRRIVAREVAGSTSEEVVARLFEAGLIDRRAAEALAIRRRISAAVRRGERTSQAILHAAEAFCCSYEKARGIYYRKNN